MVFIKKDQDFWRQVKLVKSDSSPYLILTVVLFVLMFAMLLEIDLQV